MAKARARALLLASSAFVAAGATLNPLFAADTTWTNGNTTNIWSDNANWDTNAKPTAADNALIDNAGTAGTAVTVNSSEAADTVTVSNGNQVSITSAGSLTATTITNNATIQNDGTLNGTVNNAGTLNVGSGGTGGALSGDIANTDTLTFNRSDASTYSGIISGNGAVTKSGAGTLTLSGLSTYTGTTTISAGTVSTNQLTFFNPGALSSGLGLGDVALDGGALQTTATGSLANNLTFNANKTSILSASSGTTLTLGGDPNISGNTATDLTFGANAVAQFGTTTDTGTIRIGASANLPNVDASSSVVVGGGTLQDFQDQLWQVLASVDSLTINAGATVDFNDSAQQVLVNLNGAGTVASGATGTNTLTIFSFTGRTNTFSGTISGSHPVSFNTTGGNATMILAGDNTYTGGTTICTCQTLQLGNGGTTGSILGDVVNEGTLIFNRSNAYTFNGVISDIGDLIQNGAGNTVLTATNTYTGSTAVNTGTLSVNGSIASSSGVTVNSGGTLGGTGTVPSTIVNSGGTLAPGNSIGTITVNGNMTFNSGSTYAVEVSLSAADRTNVTGTATLAGTVAASFASGNYITKSYTILSAGTRTGTFDAFTTANLPVGFSAALSYSGNDVLLDLTMVGFTSPAALPRNQQNVFDAINAAFLNGAALPSGFVTLVGLSNPVNAYGQTAGEPGASVTTPGIVAMGQLINTIFDQALGGDPAIGGPIGFAQESAYAQKKKPSRDAIEAYAAVTPRDRAAPAFEGRWGVWASAYGGNSRVDGDSSAGTSTTTSRTGGLVAGADYRATPNLKLGFALGGAGTSFSLDGGFGSGKADMFNAAVYGKYDAGPAYLAGVISYAWQDTTTDRTVTVSGTDKLHAAFKSNALAGRIEAGWRYATPMVGVTPYVAAQATAFYLPGYSETATSGSDQFALSYASHTTTATRGELGTRFDKAMPVDGGVVTLNAKTAWSHGWNRDRTAAVTFQQLPGASFSVNGARPGPDAALVSLGAGMTWHNGWSVAGSFDGELSATARVYAGKGTVRYLW